MSIKIMSQVWENGPQDQGDLLVLLALADYANDAGECFPSMKAVGEKARMTDRGARKAIRRLEGQGYVKTQTNRGRGACNKYTVIPEPDSRNTVPRNAVPRNSEAQKPELQSTKTGTGVPPEPSGTVKEPSVRAILLEVASDEVVDGFIEHRRSIKKPLTRRAATIIANKLKGDPDPDATLDRSVANGWTGVFPERNNVTPMRRNQQVAVGGRAGTMSPFGFIPEDD